MRIRKKPLGDKNLVGARIESIRRNRGMKQKELLAQRRLRGVDLNASALSKLEGQLRTVTGYRAFSLRLKFRLSMSSGSLPANPNRSKTKTG